MTAFGVPKEDLCSAELGLAGVQPDPHLERTGRRPRLDIEPALDRDAVRRRGEDGEVADALATRAR
jgi:hypothetical protein